MQNHDLEDSALALDRRCVACAGVCGDLSHYRLTRGALSRSALALLRRHPAAARVFPGKRLRALLGAPIAGSVRRCTACGLAQLGAMPSEAELARYYAADYWAVRGAANALDAFKSSPRGLAQLAFIRALDAAFDPGAVLELGAGAAAPSLLMRAQSQRASGVALTVVEPAEFWRAYYVRHHIEVLGAAFPPLEGDRRFDHIHTSHWLEHVVDPGAAVAEMTRALAPGGSVFVEVPFADDDYWELPIADFPHTLFFSPASLCALFERRGFTTRACTRVGPDLAAWSRGVRPAPPDFARANKRGLWIRALFTLP